MSVREFNANISRALAQVDGGADLVLTRNGKRWIRLTRERNADDESVEADIQRLFELIEEGIDIGGPASYDERTR